MPTKVATVAARWCSGRRPSRARPWCSRTAWTTRRTPAEAATCLEAAIVSGEPFEWDLRQVTLRLASDGEAYTITFDATRDAFGAGGVVVERCASVDVSTGRPVGASCEGTDGDGFASDSVR